MLIQDQIRLIHDFGSALTLQGPTSQVWFVRWESHCLTNAVRRDGARRKFGLGKGLRTREREGFGMVVQPQRDSHPDHPLHFALVPLPSLNLYLILTLRIFSSPWRRFHGERACHA